MTTQELVERLEEIAIMRDLTASFHSNPSLIREERETASKTLRAAASRLSEMDAENKRLREALKPFSYQHDKWSERFPDTQGFAFMPLSSPADGEFIFQADIMMGDFRNARAALEHQQHDKGEPKP